MNVYPSSFRLPEWSGYGYTADMGVRRTKMEGGNTRQRRAYTHAPAAFRLRFLLQWSEVRVWQAWWMSAAYDWFQMDAVSGYVANPITDRDCAMHVLRCVSNIRLSDAGTPGYCYAEVVVERNDAIADAAPAPVEPPPWDGEWVIAGSPDNPAVDWIIARTPDNPAPPPAIVAGFP